MGVVFDATYNGRQVQVLWVDGELSGDPETVFELKVLAARSEGETVGIPTAGTRTEHLRDPRSTYILLLELCQQKARVFAGTLPDIPEIPDGVPS